MIQNGLHSRTPNRQLALIMLLLLCSISTFLLFFESPKFTRFVSFSHVTVYYPCQTANFSICEVSWYNVYGKRVIWTGSLEVRDLMNVRLIPSQPTILSITCTFRVCRIDTRFDNNLPTPLKCNKLVIACICKYGSMPYIC